MTQVKEYHINNSTIRIFFGDILQTPAEVIVSSDDTDVSMGGGVSGTIREAEGTGAIYRDTMKNTPAEIGDVVVSTAGTLPQKYLFHVITCDFAKYGRSKFSESVSKEEVQQYVIGHSIDKCFSLLHALDLKSIAFPSLGTGVARIPLDLSATVMAEAIGRNLRKTNRPISVEVYLYDSYGARVKWDYLPVFERFSSQEALSKMLSDQAENQLVVDAPGTQKPSGKMPDIDKDVFISYSREDANIVKPIYEWLEKKGCKCWFDVDCMFSGVSFKEVIIDAIDRCKVMLFMSSEHSNKSRNVVSEVSNAMAYDKKIIPIRLDKTPYAKTLQYDIVNFDYVVYDKTRLEQSNQEILKKIVSTLEMV